MTAHPAPPRISVVIPTYNRRERLRQILAPLVAQTYADYEVIVVDGGSRDGTPAMLAADFPGVRGLTELKSGPAAARNTGLRAATGEIVAFTDDDCLVPVDWLARLADGYRRHPEVSGVAGRLEPPEAVWRRNLVARLEVWVTWHTYGLTPDRPEFRAAGLAVPGATNNVSYRRAALLAVGGFSETFTRHVAGEERDLRERLCAAGFTNYLYLPLCVYHLRQYRWQDFFTQALEMALGVRRFHQRRQSGSPTLADPAPPPRFGIPGLRQAWRAGDLGLTLGLLGERVIYGLGRSLPEPAVLWLIAWIGRL